MTRLVRIHDGVEDDLFVVFSYLEDNAPEQVERLYGLVLEAATKTIVQMPNAYAPLFKRYRHIYLRPFRFYVAYRVTEETIDILAVRHGAEQPEKIGTALAGRTFD